jgi:hypothetical protein
VTVGDVVARVSGDRDAPSLTPWRVAAVAWMMASATVISFGSGLDHCAGPAPTIALAFGWLLAPILAIASTTVVAIKSDDPAERAMAAALAIAMTTGWMFVIDWMHLGMVLNGMGC